LALFGFISSEPAEWGKSQSILVESSCSFESIVVEEYEEFPKIIKIPLTFSASLNTCNIIVK